MSDTVIAYRTQDGELLCVPCALAYKGGPLEPITDPTDVGDGGNGDDGNAWGWYLCARCLEPVAYFDGYGVAHPREG